MARVYESMSSRAGKHAGTLVVLPVAYGGVIASGKFEPAGFKLHMLVELRRAAISDSPGNAVTMITAN